MIDRKIFFDAVRDSLFGGSLTEGQVKGMDATLDVWALYTLKFDPTPDIRWLSYLLATSYHEVGRTMLPCRETFARFDKDVHLSASYADVDAESGERFYGRGLVQLTHKDNYAKFGGAVGMDLVAAPDIALSPFAASMIQFKGMMEGLFTGKKLADYIHGDTCDYYNARRIINATDKASEIAGYAEKFEAALRAASE